MFTGIIQELGTIKKITQTESGKIFSVEATEVIKAKKIGDSIAINGACMTVTEIGDNHFTFQTIIESLENTNLQDLVENSAVNLEAALKFNDSLDGHLVQGHIDSIGIVDSLDIRENKTVLKIKFPIEIAGYLAFKGSITINGVSLTISRLEEDNFNVDLIPHTLEKTNLKQLKKGDKVNLETDLIARHIKRLMDHREEEASYEFLKDRNLL